MKRLGHALCVFSVLTLVVGIAVDSSAIKKVYSPIVEYREFELEARGGVDIDEGQANGIPKQKYAVGYGLFPRLFVEVYGIIEEAANTHEFEAVELELRYQVFDQGEYWIDVGLYGAYEYKIEDGHADEVEAKLLLQKSLGRTVNITNLILERELGAAASNDVELEFAWSSRYRWRRSIEPGFELHSGLGTIGRWAPYDQQKHLVGPVVYGKVGNIKYDVGYLIGISEAAPEGLMKWNLEFEIHF